MKRILFAFFLLFIGLNSSDANADLPWNPIVVCDGPDGKAVLDGFYFSKYGKPIFAQQFVIRDANIIEFLESRGALGGFAKNEKFPSEFVFSAYREDFSDWSHVPRRLLALNYAKNIAITLEFSLPFVTLRAHDADPTSYQPIILGKELANWVFRSCFVK